jgi:hypothetical protein
LRRLVIIGTAVAVLVGAAAAYAAFNTYTGSKYSFSPNGAGTKSNPIPLGAVEHLQVAAPAGDRAAALTDIKVTIYGVRFNPGAFPTCTDAQIEADKTKYDKACPKGSEIASGPNHAVLGPGTDPSSAKGVPCNTNLHIYNGGAGTIVNFFTTKSATDCAGLTTGGAAPYDGHISYQGLTAVIDTPLPPDISTKVANQVGLYGSLVNATYTYARMTRKVKGKTVGYMQSIACLRHKRPWSITFTATDYNGGGTETQTIKGNGSC